MMFHDLKRQDYRKPDFESLYQMIHSLETVLYNEEVGTSEWNDVVKDIIKFQDADGSFKLLDSYNVESDARVDFCYRPTYLCSAILIKTFMYASDKEHTVSKAILSAALKACCGRGLAGHGYDSIRGKIEALDMFMAAGLREFLLLYPNLCADFTSMIERISLDLATREKSGDCLAGWNEDFSTDIKTINDYFSEYCVFVYGTLMEGERNHDFYMGESTFGGTGIICGFDMYDIGLFPGVVCGKGTVKGEIYKVPKESLKAIDYLENEGGMYTRQCVPVVDSNGASMLALIYYYNYSVKDLYRIPEKLQPYTSRWKEKIDDYVWYVSYGSNMLEERFEHYIKGGQYRDGGAPHKPCQDTSAPVAITTYDIPYDMYFRNSSPSWGYKGVSFIDTSKPGGALGVAYLISREQFNHVACQENGGRAPEHSSWYNEIVVLGTLNGHEVVTITNRTTGNYNIPCKEYLDTIHSGIAEHYSDNSDEEIDRYLMNCIRND